MQGYGRKAQTDKEATLIILIEVTERSRRQDKQKGFELFEIKVTDIVYTLSKAVQEVYQEHLFRHVP